MDEKLKQSVSADNVKGGANKGLQEAKEILRILKQGRPHRIDSFQQSKYPMLKVASSVDEKTVLHMLNTVEEIGQGETGNTEKEKCKQPVRSTQCHTSGYNCKCGNCKTNVLDDAHCFKLLSNVKTVHAVRSNTSSTSQSLSSSSFVAHTKSGTKLFDRLAVPKIRKTVSNIENKEQLRNTWSISDRLDELSKPKLKKERSEPIILRSLPQVKSDYNRITLSKIEELAVPRQKLDMSDLQIYSKPIYRREYKCPSRIKELAQPKTTVPKLTVTGKSTTMVPSQISETKLSKRISELAKPKTQVPKKKTESKKRWNI